MIKLDQLRIISGKEGFNIAMIEKDYLVTQLLYLIKDVKGIYFKGGTALNKIFLHHKRLSEDLDFSATRDIKEIENDIKKTLEGSFFTTITKGRELDGFTRLIVHYKLFHEDGTIFIDLNKKASIILKTELKEIEHFYPDNIPKFSIHCLNVEEMIAEKIRATSTRYKPRDYIDLYEIIKLKLPISLPLIEKKFDSIGEKFSPELIFMHTHKVFNSWNKDLAVIAKQKVEFKEVMSLIADYFKYKELKEIKKKAKAKK